MENKEAKRPDRVIQFAVAAADLAVADAKLDTASLDPHKFGVYIGSGQGGIETTFNNFKTMMAKGAKRVSPFYSHDDQQHVHGLRGYRIRPRTEHVRRHSLCHVGPQHGRGIHHHSGRRRCHSAGGTEAALRSISIAGFAAMKAISTRMDALEKASRPFDADRDGFVMGEGAGVLVLEELEHALKRGAHIYAELVGYGSTCDASHITAPDPAGDGAARAMRKAMAHAKWLPEDVDYINAHGTCTLNDKMEALAIRSVFGEHTDSAGQLDQVHDRALPAAGMLSGRHAVHRGGIIHLTINLDLSTPSAIMSSGPGRWKECFKILSTVSWIGDNGVAAFQKFEE